MSQKSPILAGAVVAAIALAAWLLDVEVRIRPAHAAPAGPGEWSRTKPFPQHEVYYPGTGRSPTTSTTPSTSATAPT